MMAEEVREEFGFDRVLFVPAARSPFKDGSEDPGQEHRRTMLELACAENPAFLVDARELGRGGISFTIDTIRSLVAQGEIEPRPGLLVGDDLVSGLPRWREFEALKKETSIIVGRRDTSRSGGSPIGAYSRASNRIIPLSSSDIRALVTAGRSIRYLVPDSVRNYILEMGLYGPR
jgi:nicotinate-nucleotide adenylyltransferase